MKHPETWPNRHILTSMAFALLIALASPHAVAQAQTNAPLDKLKAMAADSFNTPDVAQAALLGAQMIRPGVNPETYIARLDALAKELKVELQGVSAAVDATNVLSNFLYNEKGYANSAVLSADVFVGLDQVLDGAQWNCVGMSLLYAALGSRTGVPISMVAGYGHVLAAYTGAGTFFVETTAGGRLEPDREYLRSYLPFPCVAPDGYVVLNERESVALCLTQMALAMQHENRVELARKLFTLALDFSPNHAEAHGGLAFIQAAEGHWREATTGFEKAIAIDPDFREAYGGLGNALSAQGNVSGAIDAYRNLVSLCPDDEAAVFNMGQLLYDVGDLEGSIVAYERYIELQPRDPEGYMRIAFPLEDSGNLSRAAEAYDRVLQLNPNHVKAVANLGYLLEQMEDYSSALGAYERALELRPGYLLAIGGTGRVLGKTNRFDEALQTFRLALKHYPSEAFLWVDLGHLFEDYGDPKQAIAAFQEATRAAPTDPEGFFELARALNGVGLREEAFQVRAQAQAIEDELERRDAIRLPSQDTPLPDAGNTELPQPPMEALPNKSNPEEAETDAPMDSDEGVVKETDSPPTVIIPETPPPSSPKLPSTKSAPQVEKPVP